MKIRELVEKLSSIKDSLQDKEVYVLMPNSIKVDPRIKYLLKYNPFDKTSKNVDCIILNKE